MNKMCITCELIREIKPKIVHSERKNKNRICGRSVELLCSQQDTCVIVTDTRGCQVAGVLGASSVYGKYLFFRCILDLHLLVFPLFETARCGD